MDDYVEKVNNHPKVDDYLLTIFIHFWIVTIPGFSDVIDHISRSEKIIFVLEYYSVYSS